MKRILRLFPALLLAAMMTSCASTGTVANVSTDEVLNRMVANLSHPGGVSMNYHINLGPMSMSGQIIQKGQKAVYTNQYGKVWTDGVTRWVYEQPDNRVTILKANETGGDGTSQAMDFLRMLRDVVKDSKNTVYEKNGKYELVVVPNSTSPYRQMKKATLVLNKQTCAPEQIRLKIMVVTVKVDITNFTRGNFPDNIFVFNRKEYPNATIVNK